MNRKEDEERKKQVLRFFDYAENPIKEWIGKQLNRDPAEIFNTYNDESDVISINVAGEQYLVYLSTDPATLSQYIKKQPKPPKNTEPSEPVNNEPEYTEVKSYTAFVMPEEPIHNKDKNDYMKLYQARSAMIDAVNTVYAFVVKSLFQTDNAESKVDVKNPFDEVIPLYDEQDKCFRFVMINRLHYTKSEANYHVIECTKQLARINDGIKNPQFNPANLPKIEENRQKLYKLREEQIEKWNNISEDAIAARQVICDEANKNFTNNKLYIVLEHNKLSNNDQIMKRLPDFGDKYADLEDDTLVDKFKKEMNVTD